MKSLYIDTSGGATELLFADCGRERAFGGGAPRQSGEIFAAIESVLGKTKVADLDFVAVITGPGSFTGIRLGLAIAEGFQIAAHVPVFGLSVFKAIHISTGMTEIAIPAGNGEVYYSPVVPARAGERRNDGLAEFPRLLKASGLPPGTEIVSNPKSAIYPAAVLAYIDGSGAAPAPLAPTYVRPHYAVAPGTRRCEP